MKNLTAAAVLAIALLAACKKADTDDTPDPVAPTCRLSEISFSAGGNDSTLYTFLYTSGVLAGITTKQGGTTTTRTFQQAGANIILVKPHGSSIVDSVFLNDDGLTLRHRYRQYIASGLEEITEYAYAGTEVYRKVFRRFQNASPVLSDTTYFQWSRGNLFREIHDGVTVVEYAYDTDRPIPASGGDFFQLRTLLLQGAPVFRNQHFVSAMQAAGGNGDIVSYEFDGEGKVTRMSGADGTYRFQYACN